MANQRGDRSGKALKSGFSKFKLYFTWTFECRDPGSSALWRLAAGLVVSISFGGTAFLMLDVGNVRTKSKLEEVVVVIDKKVRVTWMDGVSEHVDLYPLLANHRSYVALRSDKDLFATISVAPDRLGVVWADGSRISSSALQRLPRTEMNAQELRAIMDDLHLSVEGLSALLGLSKRVVSDYRSGAPIPKSLALAMRYLEERGGF